MEKPILKNEIEARITGVAKVEDNIIEAKEFALQLKEYYSKLIFTDDQLAMAKDERASINKVVKKIADYRKNIVAEFKKPIDTFEKTAKETECILKETADFVDMQVKKFENEEKEEKRNQIINLYSKLVEELKDIVPINKIFDDRWLNKTVKIATIETEIKEKLDSIRTGLNAIEELNSEFELELKNSYLQDFDLSKVIVKNNQLKEQKERLSKVEEKKEEIVQEKVETMLQTEIKEDISDPILTYTLKITGPLTKQKALKEFLILNKMTFEKVD